MADTDAIDQFMSHVLHTEHKPMPMVLVNRKPRGVSPAPNEWGTGSVPALVEASPSLQMFGHQDLRTPQNAAWLAGFKFAKKRVFM